MNVAKETEIILLEEIYRKTVFYFPTDFCRRTSHRSVVTSDVDLSFCRIDFVPIFFVEERVDAEVESIVERISATVLVEMNSVVLQRCDDRRDSVLPAQIHYVTIVVSQDDVDWDYF